MLNANSISKFKGEFSFVKSYFTTSYELFRNEISLKDFIDWRTMMKVDSKPIDFETFKNTFEYSKETYDYYYDYLYWWDQMQIYNKRAKIILLQGGKK